MNLSDEVIAYLRDEAYAVLCKESLTEAIARIESEKEQIMTTRPPFMMLATKKTRHVFETSLRSALHTEAELRNRHELDTKIVIIAKTGGGVDYEQ